MYSNWLLFREYLRAPCAEFFGVLFFLVFGLGVDCQVTLGGNKLVSASSHGVCIFEVTFESDVLD